MKTAIIYATTHGTTERVAQQIEKQLGNAHLFNLKQVKKIDLSQFDQVVIGGSIHAGQIQNDIKNFCKQNMVDLLQKRVALYLCGMNEPDYQAELSNAYPELLRKHAIASKVVGGEFLFDRMNFIERFLVRRISGVSQTVSKIDEQKVFELVQVLSKV